MVFANHRQKWFLSNINQAMFALIVICVIMVCYSVIKSVIYAVKSLWF